MRDGTARFAPGANVLIRIRENLASHDIADAIVDAPSDHFASGMMDSFRSSAEHAADIRKIVADLHARFPQAPIFLIGTSRGTISVAHLAVSLPDVVQGAILSSTVGPCDPLAPHGYFGREEPVTLAMRNFMLGREFTRDIGAQP